ncbi:tRNA (guanosine(37)-N1)-methyltransferase TrmD [candidate division KSB1 bacterium]|nr:tRNA (guanosine(37)-N1)-methyltransferase TrmD [candidate division KSB1 bacterium]MBL7093294.1 tRNA (guanosine(37)-N1)-methyltransferase TrmD [candidate division KSB1 bacterium]
MKIHVITAFPDLLRGSLDESIIKRSQEKQLVEIIVHNLRDYSEDKHKRVDDYPYGGSPGMILKPEPIFNCIESVIEKYQISDPCLIFMTPQGQQYTQAKAIELSQKDNLFFLCGHYKGVDERVREYWEMDEISIGDYVLTGGELPALVVIDSVIRLIPGVISDINSAKTDSFYQNKLDCPYYTRPEIYRELKVPDVLLSGHHAEIKKWQEQKAMERTLAVRKDLIESDQNIEKNDNKNK